MDYGSLKIYFKFWLQKAVTEQILVLDGKSSNNCNQNTI